MKSRQYKKGYMLVEAILGVTLISITQVYWELNKQEQDRLERAATFARDLTDVLHAIDKRVLLDGREDTTTNPSTGVVTYGNWDASWSGYDQFKDNMVGKELVARFNGQCGDPVNGWNPKLSVTDTDSLVSCSKFNKNSLPFDFTIESKRSAINGTDRHVLKDWYFLIHHSTRDEFHANANYYSLIKEKAKLYDVLEMTGRHDITFVDRTDPNLRELPHAGDCIKAEERCGILFRYRNSHAATASEDGALRRDGGNSLIGDLVFRTSAGSATRCYQEGGVDVSCGFEFNPEGGELNTSATRMTAANFYLIQEDANTNIPITTLCDKGANDTEAHPCGITLYKSGASVEAEAYFDEIYTDEVKLSEIHTENPLIIRETFDDQNTTYDNRLELSRSSIKYYNNTHGSQGITFGKGISIGTDLSYDWDEPSNPNAPSEVEFFGKGAFVEIESEEDISISSSTMTIEGSSVLTNVDNDTSAISSKYASNSDGTRSLATNAYALQGVVIVDINKSVYHGGSVAKATCPTGDSATPSVKAYSFPSNGMSTFVVSNSSLYSKCNLNSGSYINGSFDSTCEVNNTNAKVNFSVSSSGNYWVANSTMSESGTVNLNVPLTIVQYCEY